MLRNTTDIPDKLVAFALAFVMEDEDMQGIELPSSIRLKNKMAGKVHGQWGWYYSRGREIVLIVPRVIRRPYQVARKYGRQSYVCRNRSDFLVSVLAHEMRHHYQWMTWNTPRSKWKLLSDKLGKIAREVDAELFEARTIERWHKFTCAMKGGEYRDDSQGRAASQSAG